MPVEINLLEGIVEMVSRLIHLDKGSFKGLFKGIYGDSIRV